jgi:ascorbate-specific PTS system EIIC-type component UlaA
MHTVHEKTIVWIGGFCALIGLAITIYGLRICKEGKISSALGFTIMLVGSVLFVKYFEDDENENEKSSGTASA